MSSMAEESLKSFIKDFGKNGLAKVEHENVQTISYKVDGIRGCSPKNVIFSNGPKIISEWSNLQYLV